MATIHNEARDFQFPTNFGFIRVPGRGAITEVKDEVAFDIQERYKHLEEIKNGAITITIDKKVLSKMNLQKEEQKSTEKDTKEEKKVVVADHAPINKPVNQLADDIVNDVNRKEDNKK